MKNVLCYLLLVMFCFSVPSFAKDSDPDADYDRLDGTGLSKKTVNVIEWESNLEIHVYPKGSLRGLGLKLDKTNKDKPVMVISYRFDNSPSSLLIRRAILGIELTEGFKAYKEDVKDDYDKIIISNQKVSGKDVSNFSLDSEPKQLYPEGHPKLLESKSEDKSADVKSKVEDSSDENLDKGFTF